MKKIRFIVVGTGVVGERIIQQIQQHDQAEIVAIVDEQQDRLQQMATTYQLPIAHTYEEALALSPDWVYIGTPPATHASLAQQAIKKGLRVLCEKPLAHDVAEAELMAKIANDAQVETAMHFPLMYSAAVAEMKNLLQQDAIGAVQRIELHTHFHVWPRPWQQNNWIGTRKQGGFVREVFPHYLQLMYSLFGELSIQQYDTTYPKDPQLCETGVLAFGSTTAQIPFLLNGLAGIGQEEELSFIVYGETGVLKLRNWSELYRSDKNGPFERLTNLSSSTSLIDACVRVAEGKAATTVSFEEGLIVQRLIDHLLTE